VEEYGHERMESVLDRGGREE